MTEKSCFKAFVFCLLFLFGLSVGLPPLASAETLTLSQAIEIALAANLTRKSSLEGIKAAAAAKKAQRSQFFPTFSTSYQYKYTDEGESFIPLVTTSRTEFTFATTVTQPVFTGFALENRYALAGLGLNVAEVQEKLVRQDVSLQVKQAYFSLLKVQKLLDVARQTVKQIEAQKTVAENFYQVGMTPLNDLLQAQVELAMAAQSLIVARNNLEIARSNFNTILRRPIGDPVVLEDVLDDTPFTYDLAYCTAVAEKNRLEIKIADLKVAMAEKEIELVKGDYYPSVRLQGNYFRVGDDWDVNGGDGVFDPDGWNITAVASWNFWQWGKTRHSVTEKRRKLAQARYSREEIKDRIRLEVKKAWLRTREAEENIKTVRKAIEQAEENFRINKERYKEQVATNTDVLIAQTLLSKTKSNYYRAVYDFQILKASLYRAIGREVVE